MLINHPSPRLEDQGLFSLTMTFRSLQAHLVIRVGFSDLPGFTGQWGMGGAALTGSHFSDELLWGG